MNIASVLERTAAELPRKPGYVAHGRVVTYGELHETVSKLAAGFHASGLARGDRVAIWHHSSIEFVALYFAVLRLGAVVVPVNVMLKEREAEWLLSNPGVSWLFFGPDQAARAAALAPRVPALAHVIAIGGAGYTALCGTARLDRALEVDGGDTATIIYTSGTTGSPKGAEITHGNFDANTAQLIEALGYDERMVRVSATPLFHTMGLTVNILASTRVGALAVLLSKLEIGEYLALNERHRATMVAGAPALHYLLLHEDRTRNHDLSSWLSGFSGSAPLAARLQTAFSEKFGIPLLNCYGLTEATTAVTVSRPDRPVVPGSVGMPLASVEVQVAGPDGRALPPGESGEIRVRGPIVMKGYLNDPEATAAVIRDGWLCTGDVGVFDTAGNLFVVDRLKDMLVCSGYNVYPRELEDVLLSFPGVADAAVVGVEDPKRGESPFAFVIRVPGSMITEAELLDHARANLAAYKAIKRIEFVDELPRNPSRKFLKRELRKLAGERLRKS